MSTLRFHKDLYAREAVDEAAAAYGRFASCSLSDEANYLLLTVTANDPARQARIEAELSNYALGLTIERAASQGSAGGVA